MIFHSNNKYYFYKNPAAAGGLPFSGDKRHMKKTYKFTISEIPRTKKNSQRIRWIRGRPIPAPSLAYEEYEAAAGAYVPRLGLTGRYNVKAVFYMPTRHRVDLVNLEEAICDILVCWGCIEDDSCKYIVSMDGSRVKYDKNNPRTEVEITELDENEKAW